MATKKTEETSFKQKPLKTPSPDDPSSRLPDQSVAPGEEGSVIRALVDTAASFASLVSGTVTETKDEATCSSFVGSLSPEQSKLDNDADDEDDSVVAGPSASKRRVFQQHTALRRIEACDSSDEELDTQHGTTFAGKIRYQRILRNRPLRNVEQSHTVDSHSDLLQSSDSAPKGLFSPIEFVGNALIRKISSVKDTQCIDPTSPTEGKTPGTNIPHKNTTTFHNSDTYADNSRRTKTKPVNYKENATQHQRDSSSNAVVAVLRPGHNHHIGESEQGTYFCCHEGCSEKDRSCVNNRYKTAKKSFNCITWDEIVHSGRAENAEVERDDEPENSKTSFKTTQPAKNIYDDIGKKNIKTTRSNSDCDESTVLQGRKSDAVDYTQQSNSGTKVQHSIKTIKKNDHDRNQKQSNTQHKIVSPIKSFVVNTAVGFYDEISTEGHICVETSKAVYDIPEASHTQNNGVWLASHYSGDNEIMCSTICASQVETNEVRPATYKNGEGAATFSSAHEESLQSSGSSQLENNCTGPVSCNIGDDSACKPSVSFAERHGVYPASYNRGEHATAVSVPKSYCTQYDHRLNKDTTDLSPTCRRFQNEEKHSRPFNFDRIGDSLSTRYEFQSLESQDSRRIRNILSVAEEEVRRSRRVKFQDEKRDKYAFDNADMSFRDGMNTLHVYGSSVSQTQKTRSILKNLTTRASMSNPATDGFQKDARSDSTYQFFCISGASKRPSEPLNNHQWDTHDHKMRSQHPRSWDSIYTDLNSEFKFRKIKDMYGSNPILNETLTKRNIPYLHDQFMVTRGNRLLGRKRLIGGVTTTWLPPGSKPPAPPDEKSFSKQPRCPILISREENSTDVKHENPKEKELGSSCKIYEQSTNDKTDSAVDADVESYKLPSLQKRITLCKVGQVSKTLSTSSKTFSKLEKETLGISPRPLVFNRNSISATSNKNPNQTALPKVSSESERSKYELQQILKRSEMSTSKQKHISGHVISCHITGKGSITALSKNRVAIELNQVLDWKFTADPEPGQQAKSLGHFGSQQPNSMSRQSPRVNYCDNHRNRLSKHSCRTSPEISSEIKLRDTKSTGSHTVYQNRCSENYSLPRDLKNYQLSRSRFDSKMDRLAHYSKPTDNLARSREQSICLLCAAETKQLHITGGSCSSERYNIGESVHGLTVQQSYDLSDGSCTMEKGINEARERSSETKYLRSCVELGNTFSCVTQVRGETREHRFETEDAQRMGVDRNDSSLCATRHAEVDTTECSPMSIDRQRKFIKQSNTTSRVTAQEQNSLQEAGTSGEGDREAVVFSAHERRIEGSHQTCHNFLRDFVKCESPGDQTQAIQAKDRQPSNFDSQCSHTSFPPVLVNSSKVDSLDCLGGHQSNHFMEITLQMAGGEESLGILQEFSKGRFSTKEETACEGRSSRNSQKTLTQRSSQNVKANNNLKNSAVKALNEQAIQWEKNVVVEGVVWYKPTVNLSKDKAFDEGSVPEKLPSSAVVQPLRDDDHADHIPAAKQHLAGNDKPEMKFTIQSEHRDIDSNTKHSTSVTGDQRSVDDGHHVLVSSATKTDNLKESDNLEFTSPQTREQHLTSNNNSDLGSSSTKKTNLQYNQTETEDGHVLRFIFSTTTVNRKDTSDLETNTSKVVKSVSENKDTDLSETARKETHCDQLGDETSQQDTDSGILPHPDTLVETEIEFVSRQVQEDRPLQTNTNTQTKPNIILEKTAHSDYNYSHFERVSATMKREQHAGKSGHSRHMPDVTGQHIGKISHLKTFLNEVTDSHFGSRHTPNRVTPEENKQTLCDIKKMHESKKHGVGRTDKQADLSQSSADRTPETTDTAGPWTFNHPLIEAWKLNYSPTEARGVFFPKSTIGKVKYSNPGSSTKEIMETQDFHTDRQPTGSLETVLRDEMEGSNERNEAGVETVEYNEQNGNCSNIIYKKETVDECRNKEMVKGRQTEAQPFGHDFYDPWKAEKIRKDGRIAKKTITSLPKVSRSLEQNSKGGNSSRHKLLNSDRKEKVSHKQEIKTTPVQHLGVHDKIYSNKLGEHAASEHPSCSTDVKSSHSAEEDVSGHTTCAVSVKCSNTLGQKYASGQTLHVVGVAKDTGLEQFPCVAITKHTSKFGKNVSSELHPHVKKIKRSCKVRQYVHVDKLKSQDKLKKHVVLEQAQCVKNEEKSHALEKCASTGNCLFCFSARKSQTCKDGSAVEHNTCVNNGQAAIRLGKNVTKPGTEDALEPSLCNGKVEMSSEKDTAVSEGSPCLKKHERPAKRSSHSDLSEFPAHITKSLELSTEPTKNFVKRDLKCVTSSFSIKGNISDGATEMLQMGARSQHSHVIAIQRSESLQEQRSNCKEISLEVTAPDATSKRVNLRQSGKNKHVAKKKKSVRMDGKRNDIHSNQTEEHYCTISVNLPKSHNKRRMRLTKADEKLIENGHKQVKHGNLSEVAQESGLRGDFSKTDCINKQTQEEARGSRSDSDSLSSSQSLSSVRSDLSMIAVVHSDSATTSNTDSPMNAPPIPTVDSSCSFDVETCLRELEMPISTEIMTNDWVLRGGCGHPNADNICNKNSAATETSGKASCESRMPTGLDTTCQLEGEAAPVVRNGEQVVMSPETDQNHNPETGAQNQEPPGGECHVEGTG